MSVVVKVTFHCDVFGVTPFIITKYTEQDIYEYFLGLLSEYAIYSGPMPPIINRSMAFVLVNEAYTLVDEQEVSPGVIFTYGDVLVSKK